MKIITTSICVFLAITTYGQDSLLTIKGTVKVPGATKDEMFSAARKWFVEAFPDSKDKFLIEDKQSGELSTKGITIIPVSYTQVLKKRQEWETKFSANFLFRDGQYKYQFTNIETQKGHGNAKFYKLWSDKKDDHYIEAMKDGARVHFERFANSLKTVMDNLN